MKIYISGRISGLPYEEVVEKFGIAKRHLSGLGFIVVNPLDNGLEQEESWQNHMIADIALLFKCDAIYMLFDWLDSKGAMIEKHIAQTTGMGIFYESKMEEDQRLNTKRDATLFKVESAIQEVTGLSRIDYAVASRKREVYFARLIFTWQCYQGGIKNRSFIGKCLDKDHATPLRALKKYPDEVKYNSEFRAVAERVNHILLHEEAIS